MAPWENNIDPNKKFTGSMIETIIKIAILGILVLWTFFLIKPFLIPIVWGMILAIAVEPFFGKIVTRLGGKRTLAVVVFLIVIFVLLVIPTLLLVMDSIDTVQALAEQMKDRPLAIPPPPAGIADLPFVGETLSQLWHLASTNLEGVLKQFAPQIKTAAARVIGFVAASIGGGLSGFFMTLISICIAGVFLATSEKSALAARQIFVRVSKENGSKIADLAVGTIRGVMQGVVGVSFIQALLSLGGMMVIKVPAAGFWAILVLVCAVSQLPIILILGPVAAYVFWVHNTTPAVIFLVWVLFVTIIDGFLKPLLMGRGLKLPMLVILLGSLGGMILHGIIGLFVGAVVLGIMYTLFMTWLDEKTEDQSING
jgi:predicted PurR-regulated permease PerM